MNEKPKVAFCRCVAKLPLLETRASTLGKHEIAKERNDENGRKLHGQIVRSVVQPMFGFHPFAISCFRDPSRQNDPRLPFLGRSLIPHCVGHFKPAIWARRGFQAGSRAVFLEEIRGRGLKASCRR